MNKNYIKIVLLGDGRVGKTSILNRYINNKFNDKEEMTINSCYFEKELEYNGEKFIFCLWDTAGQEKFNALTPIYYRDAKGAILVYDVSIAETFKRVKKWTDELKAFNKNTIIAIAGNKYDLKNLDISKEEVEAYCTGENAKHFYTSAKTGEGLEEIFLHVTKEISIVTRLNANNNQNSSIKSGTKKLVVSKNNDKTEKGGCCK